VAASAALLGLAIVALVATAHPRLLLAPRMFAGPPGRPAPVLQGTLKLSQLGAVRAPGVPWNAPGNVVFQCQPRCPELRVDLEGEQHAAQVEVSTDHNDRYELLFYRQGRSVGRVAWGAFEGAGGLRVLRLEVPPEAQKAGYDTLAVRPLYGDGQYGLGHLRLF
jgi:hypothetical protein